MTERYNGQLSDWIELKFPFMKGFFRKFPWIMQFVNFSIVGVINMLLSYLLYAFFVWIGLHIQIANMLAFWLSVLNGYVLNKYWVFKNPKSDKEKKLSDHITLVKYVLMYGFNMLLGVVLLYLYVDILHLNKYIAPLISIPITIPMNYCLNRFWVFKKKITHKETKNDSIA